jgi:hypothetical protein
MDLELRESDKSESQSDKSVALARLGTTNKALLVTMAVLKRLPLRGMQCADG